MPYFLKWIAPYLLIFSVYFPFQFVFNRANATLNGWFYQQLSISVFSYDLAFIIVGIAFYAQLFQTFKNRWKQILVVMTLPMILLVIPANNTSLALYGYLRIVQAIFVFFLLRNIFNSRQRGNVIFFIVLLGVFQSIIGAAQVSHGHSLGLHYLGEESVSITKSAVAKVDINNSQKLLRAYGTFQHPNILGAALLVSLFASFLCLRHMKAFRPILYGCSSLILFGIFLTFSRATYISTFLLIIFVLIYFNRDSVKIVAFAIFLFIFAAFLLHGTLDAFVYRIVPAETDKYISDRIIQYKIWQKYIITRKPITGTGINNYVPELLQTVPRGTNIEFWHYEYPHNYILAAIGETGLIGGMLLVLLVLRLKPKLTHLMMMTILSPILLVDHFYWSNPTGRIIFVISVVTLIEFANLLNERGLISNTRYKHNEPVRKADFHIQHVESGK